MRSCWRLCMLSPVEGASMGAVGRSRTTIDGASYDTTSERYKYSQPTLSRSGVCSSTSGAHWLPCGRELHLSAFSRLLTSTDNSSPHAGEQFYPAVTREYCYLFGLSREFDTRRSRAKHGIFLQEQEPQTPAR